MNPQHSFLTSFRNANYKELLLFLGRVRIPETPDILASILGKIKES